MIYMVVVERDLNTMRTTAKVYENGHRVASGQGADGLSAVTSAFSMLQMRNPRKLEDGGCAPEA